MRLLRIDASGDLSFTRDLVDDIPPYAILSHTWGSDEEEEVTFDDLTHNKTMAKLKPGYSKIQFCETQAQKDNLQHFWVDTCSIDKRNSTETGEAINSMFRWYQNATKCYVYLSDVSALRRGYYDEPKWESSFRTSRWFTRGWTLQELLAPRSVDFFSREGIWLGSKTLLERQIHEITGIPVTALTGTPISTFSVEERMRWAAGRNTKKREDRAYCLFGIFNVFIPLIYGEGDNAFKRLEEALYQPLKGRPCCSPSDPSDTITNRP